MNIHEYQAKKLFADYSIPVPEGSVAITPKEAIEIAAIYEYKVIMQAAFWRINPFDQFGVELGKDFANALLNGNEKNVGLNPEILEQFLKLNSK